MANKYNNILLTCFEPFGGESFNASAEIVFSMPEHINGCNADKLLLPVEFGGSAKIAISHADKRKPELIVCFGEARSRKAVTPELVAINLKYASIPDNAGAKPMDEPIEVCGKNAYFTKFPARELASGINARGTRSALSLSAGAYVCNDLYYRLMSFFECDDTEVLFIHVPRMENAQEYRKAANDIAEALGDIMANKE